MDILTEVVSQITPTRNFNLTYIILDTIFLLVLAGLLVWKKRYLTLLFGLFGGILYLIVDYGGFYALSHTREVLIDGVVQNELNTFWVLLWMSMSYGFTNFIFIWTLVSKDKLWKYWIFMIVMWWICVPSISLIGGPANIQTRRTTNAYHGYMALALVISYLVLIIWMLYKKQNFSLLFKLNLIGVSVQFAWEVALLINGVRPLNNMSVQTLIVNSLIETNLGMPLIYLIYLVITKYFKEDLKKQSAELIEENQ